MSPFGRLAPLPLSFPKKSFTIRAANEHNRRRVAFAWDYFQRPVPLSQAPPIPVAAEMIYWERPGGGRVFHAGSINAGSTLAVDPKWSGLLRNVLSHFQNTDTLHPR